MASRSLDDLKSDFRLKVDALIYACEDAGIQLLVYCTHRSFEEQALLYCQGRKADEIAAKAREIEMIYKRPVLARLLIDAGPQPGKIVTRAGPGQSLHQYGYAIDGVPLINGKPVWDIEKTVNKLLWAKLGRIGAELGLEWAGYWLKFKEYPHFQEPGIRWQDLI